MEERFTVPPKGRREPAESEAAGVDAGDKELPCDQDDDRLDFRHEVADREFTGNPREGIDDAKPTGRRRPGQQAIVPGLEAKDRRSGHAREAAPGRASDDVRFSPIVFAARRRSFSLASQSKIARSLARLRGSAAIR